jgi:uncharacterized OsmC-like protein
LRADHLPAAVPARVRAESIHLNFELAAPKATPEQLQALREKTEQYCVVMQTLMQPPKLATNWARRGLSQS